MGLPLPGREAVLRGPVPWVPRPATLPRLHSERRQRGRHTPLTKDLVAVKVGIPREVKNHEYRVAITPAGVHELVRHGHEVFVERDAGVGRRSPTTTSSAPAPRSSPTADDVWAAGDLILKVKEPIDEEYGRMREGQTLFTYLHLAADKPLHRGAARAQGHRHRVRDRRAAGPVAAAARADVRGRGPAGPAGRRPHPDAGRGRPRHPDGRRLRRLRREGRRDRRRRLRA